MLSQETLQKIKQLYIKGRFLATDVFTGEFETAFKGRGIDFEEVREYVPGDDVRKIDWNVSARFDKPFVKVFREEREQTILLALDISKSTLFGSQRSLKKDAISEIASLLAFASIHAGDKIGLLLFGSKVEKFIPPKKGRAHVWHLLSEILNTKPQSTETNINSAVSFVTNVIRKKCVCFLISDFLFENSEILRELAARHDLVCLSLKDPLENKWPKAGLVTLKDLETEKEITVDLSSKTTRKIFEALNLKRNSDFLKNMRSLNADPLLFETGDDIASKLIQFFKMRERRK